MEPISAIASAIPGIARGIGSLFGGRARRRRERKAKSDYKQQLGAYKSFEFENPYADLENTFQDIENPFEDIQVATQAAEFQAQQQQQGLAQTLEALRGAGGGTGAAAIAQALAQEQRRTMQGIAADIASQEAENIRLARQGAQTLALQQAGAELGIQEMGARGETARQAMELERTGDVLGIAAGEAAAARGARQQARSGFFSGLGGLFGAANTLLGGD